MHNKVIEFNLSQRTKNHPEVKTGDVIRVHRKIKEGDKERVQIFEGLVIRIQGRQSSSPMLTVRKTSLGIGVELMLPLHSPIIEKIEVIKKTKTRRSRLYFVRNKTDRALRKKLRASTLSKTISSGENQTPEKDQENQKAIKEENSSEVGQESLEESKEETSPKEENTPKK